ncbi:MAG TPA: CehA/McbA family metallohydrolase, partial [Isosphaeraceae bacterium]|nr:CehA/McbA family metallohydrolase [Isosphaeraceae bacterium]
MRWNCVWMAMAIAVVLHSGTCSAQAAPGRVVILVDAPGSSPLPCRIHLEDGEGKAVQPKTGPFWHDHFDCDGRAELDLQPGKYTYEVEHGPELPAATGQFTLAEGEMKTVPVHLTRLVHMANEGWYSGDLHIHRPVDEIALLMRAEDIHIAPVITWWNERNEWKDKPPPTERLLKVDGNRFACLMAGEDEREGGALLYFHLKEPLPITGANREYPSPLAFVALARKQKGAWIDAEKPFWYDLPVWLASGEIDSIGIANNHMTRDRMFPGEAWGRPRDAQRLPEPLGNGYWSQEIYYHVLNCGLRIPPSAGSASGVLPNPVGYNRVYVHLDSPLAYDAWWQGLRAGCSFVTNGPLLRFRANGEWPGHVFSSDAARPMTLSLKAQLTSREPIRVIEVIQNGHVVRTVSAREWTEKGTLGSVRFDSSGWLLVRVLANNPKTFRFASTAPFFVEIGSTKRRISRSSARFFLDWVRERIGGIKLDDPAERQ